MAHCPNKNLEEWKLLVSSRGEDIAYYLWDKYEGNVPEIESKQSIVKAGLKAIQILNSDKAKQIFDKGNKNNWSLEKILAELAVPREQRELIKGLGKTNLNEIVTDLLANYSYTIEINTAKESYLGNEWQIEQVDEGYDAVNKYTKERKFFIELDDAYTFIGDNKILNAPTQHYSNLTVPGGTAYQENEIATPAITPSIKGHAQFATDNGIGWFRSDDKENKVLGWKEENDFLNSETAQYNPITKNDKIIWGHPAIGKSYAAKKVKMIDFDSYKIDINRKYNLHITKGLSDTELRTDNKTREARENWRYKSEENQALWNQFIRDAWQQAKKDAKEQGAILFASDLLVLREFGNEVDKALTMPDELFFERSKQRNNFIEGELGTKVWKSNLNKAINNFQDKYGKDKVIKTDKYLSELFEGNPKIRRILELQSDLFQKGRDRKSLIKDKREFSDKDKGDYSSYIYEISKIHESWGGGYILSYWNVQPNGEKNNKLDELEFKTKKEAEDKIIEFKSYKNNSYKDKENQFLQLLNKDNNWVTFFVKSIIQDSAKKGYEKVLFPSGNTASKVEGHTTLEDFKKEKENRIKELEKQEPQYAFTTAEASSVFSAKISSRFNDNYNEELRQNAEKYKGKYIVVDRSLGNDGRVYGVNLPEDLKNIELYNTKEEAEKISKSKGTRQDNEINQLKQELERVETEGFGALKPIFNFYENTVKNILKKSYPTKQVTDEYNNTWIEVNLDESHLDTIHFQKAQGIQSFDEKTAKEVASALQAIYPEISLEYTELQGVRGQANIQAGKVLIDSLNQNTDTLAHEYAHHYISWFKNSPIVQKGIRLFGSEEALVQAIGEQTVAQKAKANIWYKQFWNWIKSLFNDKQAQLERLTDSFISKKALGEKRISTAVHNQAIDPESIKSDEKLIKTINAAKLVFKNRQAELEAQYGADRIGTRESIRRIKAALDKLTWAAAYSDIISVAEAQLDVVKNILDKDYDEISNSELVDARKILYFTKEFDELLEDALHDEALAKKLEKIRSETVKVKNKFSKFVTKRLVDSSKYYGSPITPEQLSEDAAYKDVSKAKAAHMSLESTNIPHLQFAASVMNWRTHQTDAELNQFDREHRDLVKKFGEEEFKKILDAKGRLISMYSHDFYDQETSLWRAYYDVIKSKGTKQEIRAAKQALDDWYEQNYTYELTPEGEERYNKDLEDLTQAHKFDGEIDQDAVEKFKQQYHWSTKGKVNEDRSFTITENGTSRARIGEQTVFGDKWHTYLNRTPLEKYKNADFEKVKDLEAYKWYISKVQEVLRKLPRSMTIELGMYDKAIHQIALDLTDSKFSLNNMFKGLKEGSLDWFTAGLTLGQITGEGEYLTDEKGRVKPIIKPTDMEHIQNRFQYKNPIDLLRKSYEAATTYEHKLEIQPVLDLLGDALEKANKLETNFLTNRVRKNLNNEPITTAGGLSEAINMFKYREKAELTGQTRTDENSGLFSDITDEERGKLAKEREEWVQAGMIGEEPKLRRASWIKMSDALVDFTRLNLIGLRPLGAIANFSMGTLSNYVYAAREKDFNSKDLDWAVLKLRDNMLKFFTGSKVVTKEAMKIGALSLKFGVVKDTFIEDAKEYGKEKVYKKITEVLFKLQESGEYLIANQILLAKMHNTVIKNLAGKDKTLYDAFDEFGDWKTEEFGEAPEWTKLTHLNEDGLNVSKLTAFRKELDLTRYRTQGDYTTPMAAKGKFYGRIYMLFRTWLPRAIEERFGAENTYTGTKGRVITVGQGFSKSAKEGIFKGTILKYLGGATAVTLAKLTNLPIIGKHIAPNPLARNAVKAYEEYLHEIGMSDLDVENMRAQLAEIRIMILISAFALLLKGLAGDDDDDPELNFTLNTLQRVYQDLSFFTFPSSAFAIIKDPVPIKKTIEDAVEALHATAALISDPEKDIYRRGLRKGRSKTAKEWKDLFPVLSAWQSTESTFDQVFNADAYKYTGKK